MRKRHMLAGAAAFVAAALVAALGVAPAPALADPYTAVSADDLQAAIAGGETEITLGEDITASITVPAGQTLTLNLGGHKLTNEAGKHTITNQGNLTITGEGTVDNVSHARGALFGDGGTTTINGGTFTRSAEAGTSATVSGGNSWYVINVESGTLNMNAGDVRGTSGFSSCLRNNGTMNFNGGTVEQPNMIALKNEGTLVMNAGKVVSANGLQNWGTATINDGEIDGILTDFSWDETETGKLEMNGGSISGDVIVVKYTGSTSTPSVSIKGGSVGGSITATAGTSANPEKNTPSDEVAQNITVSSGQFSDSSVAKFVTSGNVTSYKQGKFYVNAADEVENLAVATVEVNGQTIYFYNTDDANTFAKENGKTADDVDRLVYFVDFETNGHGEFQTAVVKAGEAVGDQMPAVPEVEGYTVSGWYDGDAKVDATFVPTSDVTLVAMWTKNPAKSDPKTDPKTDPKPADGDKKADAPKKALPQTGDNTNMMVPVAIAVAGIVVVVAAVALRRRNN